MKILLVLLLVLLVLPLVLLLVLLVLLVLPLVLRLVLRMVLLVLLVLTSLSISMTTAWSGSLAEKTACVAQGLHTRWCDPRHTIPATEPTARTSRHSSAFRAGAPGTAALFVMFLYVTAAVDMFPYVTAGALGAAG